MDKIILYGAGNYCDIYISSEGIKYGEIIGIIDSNPQKWNTLKNGYSVCAPDIIDSHEYGKLILTVRQPDLIIDMLLHKNVNKSKIYDDYIKRKIFRKNAVRQVKIELLMETFREEEYTNVERVIVIGSNENFELIKEFFEMLNWDITVLPGGNEEINGIRETDKYVFCSENYRGDLKKIREELISENQWLIIPLFDVENTIIL